MKKAMTVGLVFAVLLGALALVAYATSGKYHSKKESALCSRYYEAMKDVKIEVTNTTEGIIVKVTSNKPEVVKLIQEYWAKKTVNPCCKHIEGSDECKEAHKNGKCTGHKSGEDHSH